MSKTEINSGWRFLLSKGLFYQLVQFVFSERRSKELILKEFIEPVGNGCNVLDIGCGPGNLAHFLPADINYIGFDVNSEYIQRAQVSFKENGNITFICSPTEQMVNNSKLPDNSVDVAIIHGVFHHVSDSVALEMLELAKAKLKKGGRMVVLEPVWYKGQSPFRKWVMTLDRGKNIKTEEAWSAFFSESTSEWADCFATIEQNLIRFYDLMVFRLTKR